MITQIFLLDMVIIFGSVFGIAGMISGLVWYFTMREKC